MKRIFLAATTLLILLSPASARTRHKIPQRGTPIIAGQPGVRVSPSGNVITSRPNLSSRDTNGLVRLRHHRMGPRMNIMR